MAWGRERDESFEKIIWSLWHWLLELEQDEKWRMILNVWCWNLQSSLSWTVVTTWQTEWQHHVAGTCPGLHVTLAAGDWNNCGTRHRTQHFHVSELDWTRMKSSCDLALSTSEQPGENGSLLWQVLDYHWPLQSPWTQSGHFQSWGPTKLS